VKISVFPAGLGNKNIPGGWSAVALISGGPVETTDNHKMELTAVIEALKVLTASCEIEVISNNIYIQKGINGDITKPEKNEDLLDQLDAAKKANGKERTVKARRIGDGDESDMHESCLDIARKAAERRSKR
jgi:ribonuclease HI